MNLVANEHEWLLWFVRRDRQTEVWHTASRLLALPSIAGAGAKKVPPPPVVLPKTLLVFWNKIFMLMPKLKK